MHFVEAKGILSAHNGMEACRKTGIMHTPEACFAYLNEFPEKYEQMRLF